jgi:hypothetical protein
VNRSKKVAVTAGLVVIAAGAASGVAMATGDDGDQTVTGKDANAATSAALRATGGGRANSVERDSENGATWEVEVTKTDGTTVDVRLDEQLGVVVIETDQEDPDE